VLYVVDGYVMCCLFYVVVQNVKLMYVMNAELMYVMNVMLMSRLW
jgi:hypothetical protein